MKSLADFESFTELLQYCFSSQEMGRQDEALRLMSDFASEAQGREKRDAMWGWWHAQQALGFRVQFSENKIDLELEHHQYCLEHYKYMAHALAEACARISFLYVNLNNKDLADHYAKSALSFAAACGRLSPPIIKAIADVDDLN